jgi:hypothetical protein
MLTAAVAARSSLKAARTAQTLTKEQVFLDISTEILWYSVAIKTVLTNPQAQIRTNT